MSTEQHRKMLECAAKASNMVTYDPEIGSMKWKPKQDNIKDAKRWNSRYANQECGTIDDKGYRRILFRFEIKKTFKIRAHRLAWYIVYGKLPEMEIDHINQDKSDNRIANLRDVPKDVNQRNGTMKGNNTSGVTGVTWDKHRNKWLAQVQADNTNVKVGRFSDINDAEKAVKEYRSKHGFTETHGRIA